MKNDLLPAYYFDNLEDVPSMFFANRFPKSFSLH